MTLKLYLHPLAQGVLRAGLADEIVLQLAPTLLCGGTRLFGDSGDEPFELKRIAFSASPRVTHLKFNVLNHT